MINGLVTLPGVCQFCGCTPDNPCIVGDDVFEKRGPCQWADEFQTVCSNLACVDKALDAGIGIWPEFCPEEDGRYEEAEDDIAAWEAEGGATS
jgi:hypothetical protein